MRIFLFSICCLFTFSADTINYRKCQVVIEDLVNQDRFTGEIDIGASYVTLNSVKGERVNSSNRRKLDKLFKRFNLDLIQERNDYTTSFTVFDRDFQQIESDTHCLFYESKTSDFIHYELKVSFTSTLGTELPRQIILTQVNEPTGERNREQIWHFYGFR